MRIADRQSVRIARSTRWFNTHPIKDGFNLWLCRHDARHNGIRKPVKIPTDRTFPITCVGHSDNRQSQEEVATPPYRAKNGMFCFGHRNLSYLLVFSRSSFAGDTFLVQGLHFADRTSPSE